MPWRDASPMDQRTQFIADHLRDALPISELCELYGVSRKTGYKWIDRYIRHGPAGLEEGSRRPRRSPNDGRGDRERDPGRPPPAPALGRQETPRAAAQATSPVEPAGALDGLRHSQPAWDG